MEKYLLSNNLITIEVSEIGAELKKLNCNNLDYLWSSNPKYWNRSAPFLFPIVGTLKDKETYINSKLYKMGSHGFLRDQKFNLEKKENNKLVLSNSFNNETLEKYPFEYQVSVTYELIEKSLKTSVDIKNTGKEVMPFNIGGHPAFNCPLYEGESFSDYRIIFDKAESFVSPFVESNATLNFYKAGCAYSDLKELKLKKDLFDIDTIVITNINSKKVKLVNQENKGIEFSFPSFNTFAIWTPFNDAPFVCLEPWIGYNDHHDTNKDFLTKDDLIKLNPNDTYHVEYTIKII